MAFRTDLWLPILLSAVLVSVASSVVDGIVYGLLTGGTFGWLRSRRFQVFPNGRFQRRFLLDLQRELG